jgi:hypothetical protein
MPEFSRTHTWHRWAGPLGVLADAAKLAADDLPGLCDDDVLIEVSLQEENIKQQGDSLDLLETVPDHEVEQIRGIEIRVRCGSTVLDSVSRALVGSRHLSSR